jgi:hypothetical protein
MGILVRTVDLDGLQRWHEGSKELSPLGIALPRAAFAQQKIEQTGETVLCWDNPPSGFSWICPGCGCMNLGHLADEPASGWEEPRWVNRLAGGLLHRPLLATRRRVDPGVTGRAHLRASRSPKG